MRTSDWRCPRFDLDALHAAAIAAVDPIVHVSRALRLGTDHLEIAGEPHPLAPGARIWIVAAGKAARGMATAALEALAGRCAGGVVVHPHGAPEAPGEPEPLPDGVVRIASSHPVPDEGSLAAGEAVARLLGGATEQDLALVLLSGGASALLERLPSGLSLLALREVTAALLRSGADVEELNTVRRALSTLKGGGLARLAAPARVITLALSDVLGDRPEAIGSGPTVTSPTGPAEALAILERTGVAPQVPNLVATLSGARPEPNGPPPPAGRFHIVASNRQAAEAVARAAAERGFRAQVVTTFLQGEAREAGRLIGGCAVSVAAHGTPLPPPACLIFGGETTVSVRGNGRGGRNQELALGAALAISGWERVAVFAFATDGVDGNSSAAGAIATGDTIARAAALGLSARHAFDESDTEPFFDALGDSWRSGPTGTNVNDLVLALVFPGARRAASRDPER